ncbi:MAG TPA: T9SS type A sorting domain-containing protein [Bacteroidetes bacterium]|nr:T9SS type A sorting domain-containing protein [Bacteroidota bacterium]
MTLDIAATISELPGGGINASGEFFEFYYALDGGAEVPTRTTNGAPPNYSVSSLDVSSTNSLVVGFNFNINGADDGWEISSFTVTSTLLPIELSSYTAYITNNDIQLNWQTASEFNNSHFTIEHSTSGRDFQPIGEVKGAGTTLGEQHYSFIHKTPTPGKNYYRLRQTDFDGQEEIHKTIVVEFRGETSSPTVFPTVVNEELSVKWSNKDDISEGAIIRISDYSGRQVFMQEINSPEERFDVSFLSQGMYFVNISDGQFSHIQKIVKE